MDRRKHEGATTIEPGDWQEISPNLDAVEQDGRLILSIDMEATDLPESAKGNPMLVKANFLPKGPGKIQVNFIVK